METKYRLDTFKYMSLKMPFSLIKKIKQYSLNNDLKIYEAVWIGLILLIDRNNPEDKELLLDKAKDNL